MRRPTLTILLAAGLALAGSDAMAAGAQRAMLGAGPVWPAGDYDDAATPGWLAGASFAYRADSGFGFGLDLGYQDYGRDIDAADLTLFRAGFLLEYVLAAVGSRGSLVLRGVAGWYFPDLSVAVETPAFGDEEPTDTETEFGAGLGAGYGHRIGDTWGAFGDATYHLAGKVEFTAVRLGVFFEWGRLEGGRR